MKTSQLCWPVHSESLTATGNAQHVLRTSPQSNDVTQILFSTHADDPKQAVLSHHHTGEWCCGNIWAAMDRTCWWKQPHNQWLLCLSVPRFKLVLDKPSVCTFWVQTTLTSAHVQTKYNCRHLSRDETGPHANNSCTNPWRPVAMVTWLNRTPWLLARNGLVPLRHCFLQYRRHERVREI